MFSGRGRLPIIGVAGGLGSGKSTVANYVAEWFSPSKTHGLVIGFADAVREGLLRLDPMVIWETRPQRLTEIIYEHGWGKAKRSSFEVRRLMQAYGTEAGRHIHGTDCWVNQAERRLVEFEKRPDDSRPKCYVLADVRFPNEAQWINENGLGCIWVDRPGIDENSPERKHASELHAYEIRPSCKLTITNDGDLDSLLEKSRQAASRLAMELFTRQPNDPSCRYSDMFRVCRGGINVYATDGSILAWKPVTTQEESAPEVAKKFPFKSCHEISSAEFSIVNDWRPLTSVHQVIEETDENDGCVIYSTTATLGEGGELVYIDKRYYDALLRFDGCEICLTKSWPPGDNIIHVRFRYQGINGALMPMVKENIDKYLSRSK